MDKELPDLTPQAEAIRKEAVLDLKMICAEAFSIIDDIPGRSTTEPKERFWDVAMESVHEHTDSQWWVNHLEDLQTDVVDALDIDRGALYTGSKKGS